MGADAKSIRLCCTALSIDAEGSIAADNQLQVISPFSMVLNRRASSSSLESRTPLSQPNTQKPTLPGPKSRRRRATNHRLLATSTEPVQTKPAKTKQVQAAPAPTSSEVKSPLTAEAIAAELAAAEAAKPTVELVNFARSPQAWKRCAPR